MNTHAQSLADRHAQSLADLHAQVWALLAPLTDPEIPVITLQELGILRDVRGEADALEVVITPTYSGCPAMGQIEDDVQVALTSQGIKAKVVTQLAPVWTTDWMSQEAKDKLRAYGIAPHMPAQRPRTTWCNLPHAPCRSRPWPARNASPRTPPRPLTLAPPLARPCTNAWTAWSHLTISNPIEARPPRSHHVDCCPSFSRTHCGPHHP